MSKNYAKIEVLLCKAAAGGLVLGASLVSMPLQTELSHLLGSLVFALMGTASIASVWFQSRNSDINKIIEAAKAEEREACAKLCEEYETGESRDGDRFYSIYQTGLYAAIRSRGNPVASFPNIPVTREQVSSDESLS